MNDVPVRLGADSWPTCAVCNKPVEKMEVFDDPMRQVRVYRAVCHGETQSAEIARFTMEDSLAISFARAFEREAIGDET